MYLKISNFYKLPSGTTEKNLPLSSGDHMRAKSAVLSGREGCCILSLSPINHNDTSQSRVSVSSCIWKGVDSKCVMLNSDAE